jgi:hypothetical protein
VLPYPRKKSILYAEAESVRVRGGLLVADRDRDLGVRPYMACVVLRLALALALELELEPRLEPPLLHFLPVLVL